MVSKLRFLYPVSLAEQPRVSSSIAKIFSIILFLMFTRWVGCRLLGEMGPTLTAVRALLDGEDGFVVIFSPGRRQVTSLGPNGCYLAEILIRVEVGVLEDSPIHGCRTKNNMSSPAIGTAAST